MLRGLEGGVEVSYARHRLSGNRCQGLRQVSIARTMRPCSPVRARLFSSFRLVLYPSFLLRSAPLAARNFSTNWIRPWWYRTTSPSQPSDPPGSVRELLTTRLPGATTYFVRDSIQLIEAGPATARYYVATNGSDNAAGTDVTHPFATLSKAAG